MKAIILASGVGKRLRPFTDRLPKSLLRVGNKTILDYQLESLINHGIQEVIVTTGPFRETLESYVSGNYRFDIRFVHNPEYDSTNYIYSLWLVSEFIDSEVLLLHGDLLIADKLIGEIMETKGNKVLVNKDVPPPEKDFKALVEDDRVKKIGVDVSGPDAYFCAPMYKFSGVDFHRWLEEMEKFINRGNTDRYAEDALNEILEEIFLSPLFFNDLCMEIDTADDLERARTIIGL